MASRLPLPNTFPSQDSYQQFQYQLSAKLARDHPELSEQLCEEMMTRQLECGDKVGRALDRSWGLGRTGVQESKQVNSQSQTNT